MVTAGDIAELEAPPPGSGWFRVDSGINPAKREWVRCVDFRTGRWERCARELVDPLLEDNARRRAETAGKRWGDGQIVASWPSDFYWRHIVPARQNGDGAYVKRILNDIDYRKFRIKEGRV